MAASFSKEESHKPEAAESTDSIPAWTYPTRMCRICREEVVPTITFYPPGLPPAFQRPVIEYKNEDEYGRLIKPCNCRGGMRYIHELCLRRSRIEGVRPGSMWKCHECGYQFNFKRLTVQKYLGSTAVSGALTIVVMIGIMFVLGFIADPIINLYIDPYDTLVGNEYIWKETDVNDFSDSLSSWAQHFMKGMVSMGLMGFLKTALLNPFQWWNLRNTGWVSGRSSGRATTGRDRAVNISWIAIVIGVLSAFYFFYQTVQTIIGRILQKVGNNIVDTQLPGDDEDLKPPAGFRPTASQPESVSTDSKTSPTARDLSVAASPNPVVQPETEGVANTDPDVEDDHWIDINSNTSTQECESSDEVPTRLPDRLRGPGEAFSSGLNNVHRQAWSFTGF